MAMSTGGDSVKDEKWLGLRVKEVRSKAGFTQQGLCQQAGLSYSTLAKIERGAIKAPSIFTIQTIAQVLNISLDTLMGLEEPAKKTRLTTKSGVRFVYFDVNGCLVQAGQRALTRLAESSGLPVDVVETAYWRYNDDACRGTLSMTDFNEAMAERLHIPKVDWATCYLDSVEIVEPMQDLMRWAYDHYHVGLITNIMPGLLSAMKQRGLLPDVGYHAVIDSSEVGMVKPDPEIYTLATDKAEVAPAEILLIDDTHANLRAAEKAGWHALLFDDYRSDESVARVRSALEPQNQ